MNEPAQPLDAQQLDELLSADLDGEFDAAAADLGLEPAVARARVDASPGAAARRQALASARAALETPPPLDDVTATRLRARAVANAGPPRTRHPWLLSGTAAAVVLIVGAVVAVAVNRTSAKQSQSASSAATPPTAPPSTPARPTLNFGAVASLHALGDTALGQLKRLSTFDSAGPGRQSNTPTVAPEGGADNAGVATNVDQAARGVCDDAARTGGRVTGEPLLRGYATVAGTPVVVLVFGGNPDPVMVVLSGDCRVLNRALLPPKG